MKPAPTKARLRGPADRGGGLLVAVVALVASPASLVSCAGSGADARKPTAALSPSREAEGEIRGLIARWAHSSRTERQALEPALVAFRQKHPDDDLSRLAEVLLSWIALDRGTLRDLHVAEVRAHQIRTAAGPGTVGDVARTVEGAAIRRQGRAEEALDLLLPLQSKLIDAWARALYSQEVLDSAVEARRWDRALALMRVWLREAGVEERATARAHIEASLERVPPADLLALLDDRRLASASAGDEEVEMRKPVAQRLAFVARADKNAELAQHLLATAGALLGDQSDVVAQLSAGASRARVEARTVGLVLSLRSDLTRRRGADIADGVAFGLGLPGSPARLVSRDDHGAPERLEEALSALSADGASVVIAGSDELEATNTAAAFAELHHIPVLLPCRPPAPEALAGLAGGKARFSFVVGAAAADVEATLAGALASRGAAPVAVLTDEPARAVPQPPVIAVRGCGDARPQAAGTPWKPLGVGGVVISAEQGCARELRSAPSRPCESASRRASSPRRPGSLRAAWSSRRAPSPSPSLLRQLQAWTQGSPRARRAGGRPSATTRRRSPGQGVHDLPAQGTEDPGEVECPARPGRHGARGRARADSVDDRRPSGSPGGASWRGRSGCARSARPAAVNGRRAGRCAACAARRRAGKSGRPRREPALCLDGLAAARAPG